MISENLDVFVEGIENYFKVSCGTPARVGTPFLTSNADGYIGDYTGTIGIAGNYSGSVHFSAPERMLMRILRDLGLVCTKEERLLDLVGEISNILSGNARRTLGSSFYIMPPNAYHGAYSLGFSSEDKNIVIIPIEWNNLTASLILSVEKGNTRLAA